MKILARHTLYQKPRSTTAYPLVPYLLESSCALPSLLRPALPRYVQEAMYPLSDTVSVVAAGDKSSINKPARDPRPQSPGTTNKLPRGLGSPCTCYCADKLLRLLPLQRKTEVEPICSVSYLQCSSLVIPALFLDSVHGDSNLSSVGLLIVLVLMVAPCIRKVLDMYVVWEASQGGGARPGCWAAMSRYRYCLLTS